MTVPSSGCTVVVRMIKSVHYNSTELLIPTDKYCWSGVSSTWYHSQHNNTTTMILSIDYCTSSSIVILISNINSSVSNVTFVAAGITFGEVRRLNPTAPTFSLPYSLLCWGSIGFVQSLYTPVYRDIQRSLGKPCPRSCRIVTSEDSSRTQVSSKSIDCGGRRVILLYKTRLRGQLNSPRGPSAVQT